MPRIVPVQDPGRPEDHGGPRQIEVDTIVLHTTEGGSADGAEDHWDRPDVTASAHYVLDGETVDQVVDERIVAWHCGNRAVHQRSIGIEVVGHADRPSTWTPAKLRQLRQLCADIVERHPHIPLVRGIPGICGHMDVPDPKDPTKKGGASHHTDPGPFLDVDQLLEGIRLELRPVEQRYPPGPPPDGKP